MYLIDTNVWIERLIAGPKTEEVGKLLSTNSSDQFHVTEFSRHAMAMLLKHMGQDDVFLKWILDLFLDGGVKIINLEPEDIKRILRTMDEYTFDYHDAYQYVAAEKYHLTLISYNEGFDQTKVGRTSPGKLMVL